MPLFSTDDQAALAGPHVGRAWFADITLPTTSPATRLRLHNGVGTVTLGGYEWRGVTDPIGGRLVSVSEVEDPQYGQAPAVTIGLTGVDLEFLRSIRATARDLEGAPCDMYWCMVDPETGDVLISLKRLFPGTLSAPVITLAGPGRRGIGFTVESIWSAKNFKPGRRWNSADQQRLYPGDLGLDFMGVQVADNWR